MSEHQYHLLEKDIRFGELKKLGGPSDLLNYVRNGNILFSKGNYDKKGESLILKIRRSGEMIYNAKVQEGKVKARQTPIKKEILPKKKKNDYFSFMKQKLISFAMRQPHSTEF